MTTTNTANTANTTNTTTAAVVATITITNAITTNPTNPTNPTTQVVVHNPEEIFKILQRGIENRATAATLCNKNSSRSHSIFTLKVRVA